MYALKTVVALKGFEVTSKVTNLGNEFVCRKRLDPGPEIEVIAQVSGEHREGKEPVVLEIFRNMDAFIVNGDGRTIEVVNRAGWHDN